MTIDGVGDVDVPVAQPLRNIGIGTPRPSRAETNACRRLCGVNPA